MSNQCPHVSLQALREAAMPLGGLDGVTTFCEMAVPLVARLAEALGLPGNSPDAVDAARDKVGACGHVARSVGLARSAILAAATAGSSCLPETLASGAQCAQHCL
jgi:hypothetical protein